MVTTRPEQIQQLLRLRLNQSRDFYKLYEVKKTHNQLLKQVLKKVELCKQMKIKGLNSLILLFLDNDINQS